MPPKSDRRQTTKGAPPTRRKKTGRTRAWVSKTDLITFLRCPYAFSLLDRGEITFEDTVAEFQLKLLVEGSEFHSLVEASAVPIQIEPDDVPNLLQTDVTVLGIPGFENAKLKIFGRPDGVVAAKGAL